MKKFMAIILISVIVVSLVTISWHWITQFIEMQKMLPDDEIIEIFKKNKEHFSNIKNSMSGFRYDWGIRENGSVGAGWKTCIINDNIYLSIRRKEYYNQLNSMKKTAEREPSINYVLKELNFKCIQYDDGIDYEYIDFCKQASTGNVAGILYCVKGKPTSHPYGNTIIDLGDDWYYYETCRGAT